MRVVILDTSVLLNVLHMDRLDLIEIVAGDQRQKLEALYARKTIEATTLTTIEELTEFATLSSQMGKGEAACIALAYFRNANVALDDRRAFARARKRLGDGRLLTTSGLMVLAIRLGLLSIGEADVLKGILEGHRFKMPFDSFASLFPNEKG